MTLASQGPEFLVNTTTEGDQVTSNTTVIDSQGLPLRSMKAVTIDGDGDFVVVWSSQGQDDPASPVDYGVYLRRYRQDGTPLDPQGVLVNTSTGLNQFAASVASETNGDFAVTWTGEVNALGNTDIFVQRYSAAGARIGTETRVNAVTGNLQGDSAIAMDADGDFVVTWSSLGEDGSANGVYAQRYNNAGAAVGSAFRVNTTTLGSQQSASVALADDGRFVVVWQGPGGGANNIDIYARYYDATGNPLTGEILVNQVTADNQITPSVAIDGSGAFVVTWTGEDLINGRDVYARRFSSTGAPLSGEVRVHDGRAGDQQYGNVTSDASGNFLVTWTSAGQPGDPGTGIYVRRFGPDASPRDQQQRVSTTTTNDQQFSAIDLDSAGRIVTVWTSQDQDGSVGGIYGQRLTLPVSAPPVVTATPGPLSYTEGQTPALLTVDPGVTVADTDSPLLVGATVTIGGYVLGQDELVFIEQGGIAGNFDASTGRLTFTNPASPAAYQAILRSVQYRNLSQNPAGTPRSIQFTVDDGSNRSSPATRPLTIVPVNDAPVLASPSTTPLSYSQGQPPIVVDSTVSVSDVDSANLVSATVRIAAGLSAGDLLNFTAIAGNPVTLQGYNPATGVLTLTGNGTLIQYQAALRTVTYANNSATPGTAPRSIQFQVNDGGSGSNLSNTISRTINFSANALPTVALSTVPIAYREGQPPVAIGPGIAVSDADSPNLASATVTIGGYVAGQDFLSFTAPLPPGITGAFDAGAGALRFTGVGTLAQYQALLRSVTYRNSSNDPSNSARSIQVVVSDGVGNSAPVSRPLQVTANAAPVVTATTDPLRYVGGGGAVAIDPGIRVTDADSATLTGAVVQLQGVVSAEDILIFTPIAGVPITGVYVPSTGTLTLSGTATVAQYQTALQAVQYRNDSATPTETPRTARFTVNDGTELSNPASRTIQLAANVPPTLTTTAGDLAYAESAGPVAIDPGILVTDADNVNLIGATIRIVGFVPGQDVLSFTDQPNITGDYNAATGELTLSGIATIANYQAALRSITYSNTSSNPSSAARTVQFVVNDGLVNSNPATRRILVTPNAAPVIATTSTPLPYTGGQGAVVVDGGVTVSDSDSPQLTRALVTIRGYVAGEDALTVGGALPAGVTASFNSTTGVLTILGNATPAQYQAVLRSVTYSNSSPTPTTTPRPIEFQAFDTLEGSVPAVRTIQLAANVAPVVTLSATTPLAYREGATLAIDPGITVSDSDNLNLVGATVQIINFVPGQDRLSVAQLPVGITASFNETTGLLTLSGTSSLANYQIALRRLSYANLSNNPTTTPDRTIQIRVNDGISSSAPASRSLQITANAAPSITLASTPLPYREGQVATAIDPALTVTDTDSPTLARATVAIGVGYVQGQDFLAFAPIAGIPITGSFNPANGTLTLTGAASPLQYQAALRSITYRNSSSNPNTDPRSIRFVVNDGVEDSNIATRGLTITANTPPVVTLTAAPLSYAEGTTVAVDSGLTLRDVDSPSLVRAIVAIGTGFVATEDQLSFAPIAGVPIVGSYNAATGILTLSGSATVAQYQAALRSITYRNSSNDPTLTPRSISVVVNDGLEDSNSPSRTIQLTPNAPPVVRTTATALPYREGAGLVAIDPGLTVTDSNSPTLTGATVRIVNFVANQDAIVFTDQNGITGSFNATTGVLTLSGTAPLAQYEAALRTVRYRNGSTDPNTAARTVQFQVTDGIEPSNTATRTIQLAANAAPVVTPSTAPLAYAENAGAVAIDPGITVIDSDSPTLRSATVTLRGYVPTEDTLTYADRPGITGSSAVVNGNLVLTLTGEATLLQYRDALRSITYTNRSADPNTAPRTVEFIVNDGVENSVPAGRSIQITAFAAPVVTLTNAPLPYREGAGAVAIDNGLTVTDPDSANLTRATVTIGGFVAAEDVLLFSNQNGITGSFNATTGVLSLSGSSSIANYITALRSVQYRNNSNNPITTPRTLQVVVSDGNNNSNTGSRTIQLAANTPPVLTLSASTPLPYREGQPPIAVDAGIAVADVDSPRLASATVTIGGFVAGQDVLGFTPQAGITGSFNATAGVLTFTGSATLAEYQAVLRSVTYRNSSSDPNTAARTIRVVVNDGAENSNAVTRAIQLTANAAPIVRTSGGAIAYREGQGAVAIDPGVTVTDSDSPTLTSATVTIGGFAAGQDLLAIGPLPTGITASFNAATGVLSLTGSASVAQYQAALRSVTYRNSSATPSPTPRVIRIVVNDGIESSSPASRTIEINPNAAPVVTTTGTALPYREGQGAVLVDPGVTTTDSDSLTFTNATVVISGFVAGQDVLSFVPQAGITGSFNATTGILSFTGEAPIATYQALLRSVRYANSSSNPNTTNRSIQFLVNDGTENSNAGVRTIQITANAAPVLVPTAAPLTYSEGQGAVAIDPAIILTDADSLQLVGGSVTIGGYDRGQDQLLFTNQNGISGQFNAETGVLTLSGSATVAQYQAALRSIQFRNLSAGPLGTPRSIQFRVNDGVENSNPATRAIEVRTVNNAPILTTSSGIVAYREGAGAVAIDPGIVVSDPDSASLVRATVTLVNYLPSEDALSFTNQAGITGNFDAATGVLTLTGTATVAQYQAALRSVTYTNRSGNPNLSDRSFQFVANDGTAPSNVANRILRITEVNTAPTVTPSAGSLTYREGAGAVAIDPGLLVNDVDSLTLAGATVTIGGYLPDQDSLSFASQLGITGSFNSATGVLTLTGRATVVDYQTALRSISYSNRSTSPSPTPRSIQYIVNDGTLPSAPANRLIQVQPTNDAPSVITSGGALSYREGAGAVAIDPGITVSDGDSVNLVSATVTLVGYIPGQDQLSLSPEAGITSNFDAARGILTLTGTATVAAYQAALRSVSYTNRSSNPSGSRSIRFEVNDGTSASAPASRAVQILSVNTAPTVTPTAGALTYTESAGAVAVDPGLQVSDPDSANLTSATVTLVGYLPAEDSLSFTPQAGITGNFNSATGVLTLIGNASVANYQAVLQTIAYSNRSNNPSPTPRSLQFQVTDSSGATSLPASRGIQITAVNSPSVIATSSGALFYVENQAPTAIDPGLSITDSDSTRLTGATVSLSSYVNGQDRLLFTNQSGISGSFDSATGVLTLSGDATIGQYQAALRSIRYANGSNQPVATPRLVNYTVREGSISSNTATRAIQISPLNDPPALSPATNSVTFPEPAAAIAIAPALQITDVDSPNLTSATVSLGGYVVGEDLLTFNNQSNISGSFNPVTGQLTLTGSATVAQYQTALRSITYSNLSEFPLTRPRQLSLRVSDGTDISNVATVRLQFSDSTEDSPSLDLNGPAIGIDFESTFVLTGPPVPIVGETSRLTDPSSPTLSSASVRIANLLNGANERLLVDPGTTGISATYNSETGTLALTGSASTAAYLQVLQSLRYVNEDPNADLTTRLVLFSLSDGSRRSAPAQTTVQITQINIDRGTPRPDSLRTTPATDLISALGADDTVTSPLPYLQQDDRIDGGSGDDTFILTDGTGSAVVSVDDPASQISGIVAGNTRISNFEYFDFGGFAGSASLTGSDRLDDRLIGGSGDDRLYGLAKADRLIGNAGNDLLDGGPGADFLEGNSGDDYYVVDHASDRVIETEADDADTVVASLNYRLGNQIENLILTGKAVQGIGNPISNRILGNPIANRLRGNSGEDSMLGGRGNDRLFGDGGNDTLKGGNGRDLLNGGVGRDKLFGNAGADRLAGGRGRDQFVLQNLQRDRGDQITDFTPIQDKLFFSRQGFSLELRVGQLPNSQFQLGSQAQSSSDRFIYNSGSGELFFDADGSGSDPQRLVLRLTNQAALTARDIGISR